MNNHLKGSSSAYHLTNYQYSNIQNNKENDGNKMHGSRRVITFCLLTTVAPSILIIIPLYLRNIKYADVMYRISDSDVIQIHKGQSSVFCEKHFLKMNSTFNAFQMKGRPELSDKRKHIQLKKSMILPDDTLEYWGFYLFKGATVELKACSHYEGSKILIVKGERILNTCNILETNTFKKDLVQAVSPGRVLVTLENPNRKRENISNLFSKSFNEEWIQKPNIFKSKNEITNSKYTNNFSDNNSNKLNKIHTEKIREKREKVNPPLHNPNTVLDAGINHGGNSYNTTGNQDEDRSVSSFENNLYECYYGNIIVNKFFPFSTLCNSTHYLEKTTTLKVTHDVIVDGYYYYIFYSDNDFVKNQIHVIFDIYKPTFQYSNMSESKICVNKTECVFDVGFLSDELVIIEVPTRDGLKNYDDILISVCHPRMAVYIIFPISVLLLVLLFAFL